MNDDEWPGTLSTGSPWLCQKPVTPNKATFPQVKLLKFAIIPILLIFGTFFRFKVRRVFLFLFLVLVFSKQPSLCLI